MSPFYLFSLFIFFDSVYSFKPDYSVKRQSRSIFSNKRQTETITPTRNKGGNRNIKYDRSAKEKFMPEHYFPEVEYPTNIMEVSKPFYFRTEQSNPFLAHFTDDVKTIFNSAVAKPVSKKEAINSSQKQPIILKSVASKTTKNETGKSVTIEPSELQKRNSQEFVPTEAPLDSPMQVQLIRKDETHNDKESIVKPKKMISLESESDESYEDVDYVTDCPEYCSYENETTKTFADDQVEVFYSDEVFFDSTIFEDTYPEDASVSDEENTLPRNSSSTSQKSEEPIVNSTTLVKPETYPVEMSSLPTGKNDANIVRKAPTRLGLGPVPNVKKRKYLKQMYKTPSIFI